MSVDTEINKSYVPEIDGLRAIAVISVILFHVDISAVPGGFVGVDIFFVISGFLITRIIVTEITETGRFDFGRFYLRRARRLLPALSVKLVFTLIFARIIFSDFDYNNYLPSLVASALSVSNILFYSESGYFDVGADYKPLLHTWSLSVEEQFYLLWPAFLLFTLYRFKRLRTVVVIIIALSVASFVLNSATVNQGQYSLFILDKPRSALFYLMPYRVFEFGVGACVVFLARYKIQSALFNDLLFVLGLVLIFISIITITEEKVFPYYNALVPCVGAALVIFVSGCSRLRFILSNRVVLYVGVISYSLYLVHWPLVVFVKYNKLDDFLLIQEAWAVIVVSALLAALMHRFIERPFRYAGVYRDNKVFVGAIASLFAVLVSFSISAYESDVTKGLALKRFEKCDEITTHSSLTECRVWRGGEEKLVFWGDSHVLALFYSGVPDMLSGYTIYILGHVGCPPLMGVVKVDKSLGNAQDCDDPSLLTDYARQIHNLKPKAVFLVARWAIYTNGWERRDKSGTYAHFLSEREDFVHNSSEISEQVFGRALSRTVNYFSDIKNVFIIKSVPTFSRLGPAPQLVKKGRINFPLSEHLTEQDAANRLIDDVVKGNVLAFDPAQVFCAKGKCNFGQQKTPLYVDDNHLNGIGVKMLWQSMENSIFPTLEK